MKRIGLVSILIVALMGAPVAMTQAPAGAARVVAVKAGRVLDVRTGKYAANQITLRADSGSLKDMLQVRPCRMNRYAEAPCAMRQVVAGRQERRQLRLASGNTEIPGDNLRRWDQTPVGIKNEHQPARIDAGPRHRSRRHRHDDHGKIGESFAPGHAQEPTSVLLRRTSRAYQIAKLRAGRLAQPNITSIPCRSA